MTGTQIIAGTKANTILLTIAGSLLIKELPLAEIWPSSTLFERGEKLWVIVAGSDLCAYPGQIATHGDFSTVNRGEHVIYTGGKYDSHLLTINFFHLSVQ